MDKLGRLEVEQLKVTSTTPPADSGFYKIDETTTGVVGDLKFRHPKTGAMSSALTATTSDGGVEESAGGLQVKRTSIATAVLDARSDLSGTAGVQRRTVVSSSTIGAMPSISGATYYVSNVAANGFVVGSDANTGLSKAQALATFSAAYAKCVDGDMIILNDSATIYELGGTFYKIEKAIRIMPFSYRGATIRGNNTTSTFQVLSPNVTIGAIILDATITSSGMATTPILSGTTASNLRLIGTQLKGNTYALWHFGTLICRGVDIVSIGTYKAWNKLDPRMPGDVVFEDCNIDGYISLVNGNNLTGINFYIRRSTVRTSDGQNRKTVETTLGQTRAIDLMGVTSFVIEDCEIGVDVDTSQSGIVIQRHATVPLTSGIVRQNRVRAGVSASAITAGYGIGIGNETATTGSISGVQIYGNEFDHVNHGIFFGYCVSSSYSWGNVVRDAIIGLIIKGASSGDVTHYSNIVVGGPLTGGALRSKESVNAKLVNNLVIWDAQSVAGGYFQIADTASTGTDFANNLLYAPSKNVRWGVQVTAGSSATFRNNNYYAGSYSTSSFYNGSVFFDTPAAWAAVMEPTATTADPLFVNATGGDYRLSASSPLRAAGVAGLAPVDFMGAVLASNPVGPLPAVS